MRMCRVPAVIVAVAIGGAGLTACAATGFESFRRRLRGYGRIGGGFGLPARGVTDVRAHGYTRVIPDTRAFRCRSACRHRHGFHAPEEFPARDAFPPRDEFLAEHEFRGGQFHGARHLRGQRCNRLGLVHQDRYSAGEGDHVREADRGRVLGGSGRTGL